MLTPRWRKVIKDLWSNKARTLLVAMSIAVGIFAVGSVSGVLFILREDVSSGYLSADPHSAIMYTDLFDDDLLELLMRTDGVKSVEGRFAINGEVRPASGSPVPMRIVSVPDIAYMQVDRLELEDGSQVLSDREVYIERGARAALGLKPGDTLELTQADGKTRSLKVAGFVHDVTTNPYSMSKQASGYVLPETMTWLGGTDMYNQLLFNVEENSMDEAHIREVAGLIEDKVNRSGRQVYVTMVIRPGEHPAQSTLDAVFVLLGGLGTLALFLSAFLVINTIISLLNQQVRQIGVMKAVGATVGQVAGMYMVLILFYGIVALLFAVPLAGIASYATVLGLGQLLNIDMAGFRIPRPTLLLEIAVGLGVPILAGLIPVFNGARMTVREAMNNYGMSLQQKSGWFDRVLENVRSLPRPLLISLRNTFRRKARLALTLFTLVLGGAIFIAVFNLQVSLYNAIDITLGYILSDVNVSLERPYRIERVRDVITRVPGVSHMEGWGDTVGHVLKPDGETSDQVEIIAPPEGSQMIQPVLTSGRWLIPGDQNAIVVGNHFVKIRPDVHLGDVITIRINEKEHPFQVVGFFEMAGTVVMPITYINNEYLSSITNQPGQVYALRVVADRHDSARQNEVAKALTEQFEKEGIKVSQAMPGSVIVDQNRLTINILIMLLLFMAVLIAVVGGLGLMGTMSMNVLERTREIGVMRSIGAVNGAIMGVVVVEGMIIGLISWALGALLSMPIARGLGWVLGVTLLNVPLPYHFNLQGLVIWVIVVIVLSALACLVPARNAVRLTVRDVLAYE